METVRARRMEKPSGTMSVRDPEPEPTGRSPHQQVQQQPGRLGFRARPMSPATETRLVDRARRSELTCTLELSEIERIFLERSLTELTPREREVVFELCTGGTNEMLAERLCIALPTLRTHLMRLNQKLGTTSKGDVIRLVAAELIMGYRAGEIAPDYLGGRGR